MKRLLIIQDKPDFRKLWADKATKLGYTVDEVSGNTADKVVVNLRRLLSLQEVEVSIVDYLLEEGTNSGAVLAALTDQERRRMGIILIVSNAGDDQLDEILAFPNCHYVGPSTNWDQIEGALQAAWKGKM